MRLIKSCLMVLLCIVAFAAGVMMVALGLVILL